MLPPQSTRLGCLSRDFPPCFLDSCWPGLGKASALRGEALIRCNCSESPSALGCLELTLIGTDLSFLLWVTATCTFGELLSASLLKVVLSPWSYPYCPECAGSSPCGSLSPVIHSPLWFTLTPCGYISPAVHRLPWFTVPPGLLPPTHSLNPIVCSRSSVVTFPPFLPLPMVHSLPM